MPDFELRAVDWDQACRVDTKSDLKLCSKGVDQFKLATGTLGEALPIKEDDAHPFGKTMRVSEAKLGNVQGRVGVGGSLGYVPDCRSELPDLWHF